LARTGALVREVLLREGLLVSRESSQVVGERADGVGLDVSPEPRQEAVERWTRIRIHTIGLDKDQPAELLKRLAAANGGTYVARL
jgi:hypothetical protein